MNILCRLGWHSWESVFSLYWYRIHKRSGAHYLLPEPDKVPAGKRCRRCGKRVEL